MTDIHQSIRRLSGGRILRFAVLLSGLLAAVVLAAVPPAGARIGRSRPRRAAAKSRRAPSKPKRVSRPKRVASKPRPSGPPARSHATPTGCANANTPATAATVSTERAAVVCLINQQRTGHYLPPLRASALLDRSAQRWVAEMVASGDFTHGADFGARITAVGFAWSAAGENIATGFQTPRQVVDAWMEHPGHCQNILDPSYADVGTGVSPHPVGMDASGPSTWAQDFALPLGAAPPSTDWGPADSCP